MNINFTKMHGLGNDYVYINGFTEHIPSERKPEIIRKMSYRHFGIGSDGVIFINPSDKADFEMEMWNADGTRAEMCGNGIRCVAKFVYDKGMTDISDITIESFGKIKSISIIPQNGKAKLIRVDMGEPVLASKDIPVISEHEEVISEDIRVLGKNYKMTCVSMGNPHAVVFMDPDDIEIEKIGPEFEHHERFPQRTNTEFVKVLDKENVKMRVWERGTGETLACGTGCCATVVACILNGLTGNAVTVHVLGGDLKIEWNRDNNHIYMIGPAETVFEGKYEI